MHISILISLTCYTKKHCLTWDHPSKVGATNRVVVEPLPGTNYTDSDKMADELRAQDRLDVAAREEKWEEVENWTISDIDNGRTIFDSKRDDDLMRKYAELNNSTLQIKW